MKINLLTQAPIFGLTSKKVSLNMPIISSNRTNSSDMDKLTLSNSAREMCLEFSLTQVSSSPASYAYAAPRESVVIPEEYAYIFQLSPYDLTDEELGIRIYYRLLQDGNIASAKEADEALERVPLPEPPEGGMNLLSDQRYLSTKEGISLFGDNFRIPASMSEDEEAKLVNYFKDKPLAAVRYQRLMERDTEHAQHLLKAFTEYGYHNPNTEMSFIDKSYQKVLERVNRTLIIDHAEYQEYLAGEKNDMHQGRSYYRSFFIKDDMIGKEFRSYILDMDGCRHLPLHSDNWVNISEPTDFRLYNRRSFLPVGMGYKEDIRYIDMDQFIPKESVDPNERFYRKSENIIPKRKPSLE